MYIKRKTGKISDKGLKFPSGCIAIPSHDLKEKKLLFRNCNFMENIMQRINVFRRISVEKKCRVQGRRGGGKPQKGPFFAAESPIFELIFFFSSTNPNMQFKFGIQIKRRNRSKRYTKILQRKTNTCNLKTQQRN